MLRLLKVTIRTLLRPATISDVAQEWMRLILLHLPGRRKKIPGGYKQRSDHGADYKSGYPEKNHSAKGGDKNHVIGNLSVSADEYGPQNVIHQPDNKYSKDDKNYSFPERSGKKEVDCDRPPD